MSGFGVPEQIDAVWLCQEWSTAQSHPHRKVCTLTFCAAPTSLEIIVSANVPFECGLGVPLKHIVDNYAQKMG